jgi:PAS domain S-box-containing protein
VVINNRLAEMLGYTANEIEPRLDSWKKLIHPDDISLVNESMSAHLAGMPPIFELEYRMRSKSGEWLWILDRGKVMKRDADGNALRMTGMHLDITERKMAEKALQESESQKNAILDGIKTNLAFVNEDLEMLWVNSASARSVNKSPKEMIGHKCHEFWGDPKKPCDGCPTVEVFKTKKSEQAIIHAPDGRIWGEKGEPVFDDEGKLMGVVKVADNITEILLMERQLQQAHKMEAIGTLASGIAHDFNNILTPILIHSEIVMSDISDEKRFHLEQVLKAGHRARNLVRQILTFCRESEQKKEPLELNPIIKEATKFLTSTLPATIDVRQSIEAESGIVLANPIQIHQVLMNLSTNAAHAMQKKGGVLEIELADVNIDQVSHLTGMVPGPYIRLSVSDTGHGIKKAVKKKIFEPFFTTKERGEGTGMGLAVVHGIVEDCGGTIHVDSEPGKGTLFQIYFPKIGEWSVSQIENVETFPRGSERILFVDNEEAICEAAKWMLHTLGYEVSVRNNGLEALEFFVGDPARFDLVITDQIMQKMTGSELAKELIKVRPDIPIVLCTGYSEPITTKTMKAMGLREVVTKPIVMSDMAVTIRRVLDGKLKRRKRVAARA